MCQRLTDEHVNQTGQRGILHGYTVVRGKDSLNQTIVKDSAELVGHDDLWVVLREGVEDGGTLLRLWELSGLRVEVVSGVL